jgi:oligopeptide/dipeptide ABC transporter ATP-binding protein
MTAAVPVLEVANLRTTFTTAAGPFEAVRGVSLTIGQGEVFGLIGESGSGKTATGLSILRLLPQGATITADALRFKGQPIDGLGGRAFDKLRGTELGMIFQDPVGAFNPVKTIAWHVDQVLRRSGDDRAGAGRLLADVGIRSVERVLGSFPHQLSGGMLQRVLIAQVVALRPALIFADEPTTNLDNIVERQILALIRQHQKKIGAAVLFVTHDLLTAGQVCDRIGVMYAGQLVEVGSTQTVLGSPQHPYTQALLRTARSLENRDARLYEIGGDSAALRMPLAGCAFAGRCERVQERCRTIAPPVVSLPAAGAFGGQVRCHLYSP